MKYTLPGAEAQALFDRTLGVVELNPDIPFLAMGVEAPLRNEVPRAMLSIASTTEGNVNERAVNRVLYMLGSDAVQSTLDESVFPVYSGEVHMPDLITQVGSPVDFGFRTMASYRLPGEAVIARARTFSAFVGNLALPVRQARIGLFDDAIAHLTADYTSQAEYEHLQTVLDGVIVNYRKPHGTENVRQDKSMEYSLDLPSGVRVDMCIYDTTPEYLALMQRLRLRDQQNRREQNP